VRRVPGAVEPGFSCAGNPSFWDEHVATSIGCTALRLRHAYCLQSPLHRQDKFARCLGLGEQRRIASYAAIACACFSRSQDPKRHGAWFRGRRSSTVITFRHAPCAAASPSGQRC
jgi:hypothetical protein